MSAPDEFAVPGYVLRLGDRREAPRREAERNLHYAEVVLLAAALALVDAEHKTHRGCGFSSVDAGRFEGLTRAAHAYRAAEAEAHAARR